jgi:hypothetical protein
MQLHISKCVRHGAQGKLLTQAKTVLEWASHQT